MTTRSGIVMLGLINGEWNVVAPFSEGRYLPGSKTYTLAKGETVNISQFLKEEGAVASEADFVSQQRMIEQILARFPGEFRPDATVDRDFVRIFKKWGNEVTDEYIDSYIHKVTANVEFREETGIDVSKLEAGEYGKARIVVRSSKVAEEFDWKESSNKGLGLDVIVVDNLDALAPYLKGRSKEEFVNTATMLAGTDLPSFETLHGLFMNALRELDCPQPYMDLLDTPDKFLAHTVERVSDSVLFDFISRATTQVKKELYQSGVLSDDAVLKLDDFKIAPLHYYQESAEIIPYAEYCEAIRSHGIGSDSGRIKGYRRVMLGSDNAPGQLDAVEHAFTLADNMVHKWGALTDRSRSSGRSF